MQQIKQLYAHLEWANQRLLDHFKQLPEIPEEAQKLFGHLLFGERLWMNRLRGTEPGSPEPWPEYALNELDQLANANLAAYRMYLGKIHEHGGFDEPVTYEDLAGNEHESRVVDILTHVALHGVYHRGQIAARLRDADVDPTNTDFITFTREG